MLEDPEEVDKMRSYLLMERIFPPQIEAQIVREGNHMTITSMSEVGLYSSLFVRNDRLHRAN